MDWAVEQARARNTLIGGFHSPLEQSALQVVLTAHAPVVIVIARQLHAASFPVAWREAATAGIAAVISMEDSQQRLTAEQAMRRNHWIACRSEHIVVAEASPNGSLATCVAQWVSEGRWVNCLSVA